MYVGQRLGISDRFNVVYTLLSDRTFFFQREFSAQPYYYTGIYEAYSSNHS